MRRKALLLTSLPFQVVAGIIATYLVRRLARDLRERELNYTTEWDRRDAVFLVLYDLPG